MKASFIVAASVVCLLAVLSNDSTAAAETKTPCCKSVSGREGWGAVTAGGRGGKVIKVSNLNASGPGSFAEACATEGPRIVVFEVSGVIRGDVRITQPHITIAGQTAPGAGITIAGMISTYDHGVHDIIVAICAFAGIVTRAAVETASKWAASDLEDGDVQHDPRSFVAELGQ